MDTDDIDRDLLIEALYQLQADLKILIDQLAISSQPAISNRLMVDVGLLHQMMLDAQPSLRRH